MNRKGIVFVSIFLIFILVTISICIQQSHNKIKKIYIPQNLDDGIISYIKNNQSADYKYPVLEISKKIPEEKLLQILSYYYLKMQIIEINIDNKDTTKTLNGSPYKRQWVEIDSNGNISIKENEHEDFRLIYNPNHPDAIRENCPEKGYVRYPDICVNFELEELKIYVELYNTFISYGNKVYPSLLLEKINFTDIWKYNIE